MKAMQRRRGCVDGAIERNESWRQTGRHQQRRTAAALCSGAHLFIATPAAKGIGQRLAAASAGGAGDINGVLKMINDRIRTAQAISNRAPRTPRLLHLQPYRAGFGGVSAAANRVAGKRISGGWPHLIALTRSAPLTSWISVLSLHQNIITALLRAAALRTRAVRIAPRSRISGWRCTC